MNSTLEEPDPDPRGQRTTTPNAPPPVGHTEVPPVVAVDQALFTAFYNAAAPRLVAFLRWQGAPLPDAAECAQEALTQCYRQWPTIEHPHAWCRLVASRLYVRRVATLVEDPTEDIERAGTPLLSPATDIEEFEQRHDILGLLEALPLRQRQVLAWAYDGAGSPEIAEALRITPEAVRASLKKARATLRAQLRPEGKTRHEW